MLNKLYIRNFALIQEMDVSFPKGLTVITGETGAGKSIFLEALGLVLGKRADASSLQDKTQKCVIEAEFLLPKDLVTSIFEEHELEFESPAIFRREISAEGKSRSFLNDSPVSLQVLKKLSGFVIDIHSQHETLLLNETHFRFDIVDAFAQCTEAVKIYRKTFSAYQHLIKQQQQLIEQEQQAKKEYDYVLFLVNELNDTHFNTGDLKKWEEESATLENAEFIKSQLAQAALVINAGDANVLTALTQVKQNLTAISKYNTEYESLLQRLQSVQIELKDIGLELEAQEENIQLNPEALQVVNEKIDTLNRLLKKHGVQTEEELLNEKIKLEERLFNFNSLSSQIETNEKAIKTALADCDKQAKALSEKRLHVIPTIEQDVKTILQELGIPNAQFKIELTSTESLNTFGYNELRFLFSANKGSEFKELQKVASGGELSRLMLSLKSLLASKKQLPTIIFDEIDTGVSGDVANKIGIILDKMGSFMQVITITHLPQIAGKGNHHLFVYKRDDEKQTTSFIKTLSKEERVTEIAKMLSAGTPSTSALKSAKELLAS